MVEALKTGMVEVAITIALDDPSLEQLPLADDHLIALLSHDGEWPVQLSPQGLLSLPLIMIKGGSEPLVRAWFARGGLDPDIRHEAQQITSLLALVRAGLSVTPEIVLARYASSRHPRLVLPLGKCVGGRRRSISVSLTVRAIRSSLVTIRLKSLR